MNYEEVSALGYSKIEEIKKSLEIKERADKLYDDFMKYVTLSMSKYKAGRFLIWKDSHNAQFLSFYPDEPAPTLVCDFLHENYKVLITRESIFKCMKSDYRGIAHLESFVKGEKKKALKREKDGSK